MLKVGLIGVGGISGAHIPAWDNMEDVELVALCDIRPEQMEKYEGKRKYTDFDEMLKNEELDILDICLPTYLHADYAVKALNLGINVLCEKPISLKREDVKRVYEAAQKNNVKFMVAQVIRFWSEYAILKEIYDNQKYGRLLSGSMTRLGSYPKYCWDNWMIDEARSGLVLYDLHIHDIDFLVYAFGTPKNTTTFRKRMPDQDYVNSIYSYDDFFITTEASWYASPYPFAMKFRFQFEDAIVAYEGSLKIYEKTGNIIDGADNIGDDTGNASIPTGDGYASEIRYFTDCIINNTPVEMVKPEQLEAVIDILNSQK